jgi:hypothetical protein
MRLLHDPHVRRIRRQHPYRNFQTLSGRVPDTHRTIPTFGFTNNLKAEAVEWMERIKNSNVLGFCA